MMAAQHPDEALDVFLEGPYGKLAERLETFDRVLVISGGVGSTFGMGVWSRLAGMDRKMIWCTRHRGELCISQAGQRSARSELTCSIANLEWFERKTLRDNIEVYITPDPALSSVAQSETSLSQTRPGFNDDPEKSIPDSPTDIGATGDLEARGCIRHGRPDLSVLINDWIDASEVGARVAVVGECLSDCFAPSSEE